MGDITEGYMYVQQDEFCQPASVWDKRYFVCYPFCGLKWQLDKPTSHNKYENLTMKSNSGGWVCGGNILILSVKACGTVQNPATECQQLFVFQMVIKCGDNSLNVKFGCESEELRNTWISIIKDVELQQAYTTAFLDNGLFPTVNLFESCQQFNDLITIRNVKLSNQTICGVVSFLRCRGPYGLMLQSLTLENVQFHDGQVTYLCSLLTLMLHITSLSIANNLVTCKGVSSMSETLAKCKSLSSVNLSGNCIADAGITTVISSLSKGKSLAILNISRNLASEACAKTLSLRLGGHASLITSINLSFNQIGNGAAAVVSLLMQITPSRLVEADVSCCGVDGVGVRELASSLAACVSMRWLAVKGCAAAAEDMIALLSAAASHHQRHSVGVMVPSTGVESCALQLALGGASVIANCTALPETASQQERQDYLSQFRCLQLKEIKHSLPYVDDKALLGHVVLHRRCQIAGGQSSGYQSYASQLAVKVDNIMIEKNNIIGDGSVGSPERKNTADELKATSFTWGNGNRCSVMAVQPSNLIYQSKTPTPVAVSRSAFAGSAVGGGGPRSVSTTVSGEPNQPSRGIIQYTRNSRKTNLQIYSEPVVDFTVAMHICLPQYYDSELDWLTALADVVEADPRQMKVLSCTALNKPTIQTAHNLSPRQEILLMFTIGNLSMEEIGQRNCRLVHKSTAHRNLSEVSDMFTAWDSACGYTPANALLKELQAQCSRSSPKIRMLGIRSVAINHFAHLSRQQSQNKSPLTFYCNIESSCRGGRDGLDEIPIVLTPEDGFGRDLCFDVDTDDDEAFDNSLRYQVKPRGTVTGPSLSDVTGNLSDMKIASAITAAASSGEFLSDEQEADMGPRVAAIVRKNREIAMAKATVKRERKLNNERLIAAIRRLKISNEITSSDIGKFWEGAFGNPKYRNKYIKGLRASMSADGYYAAVSLRRILYEAMFKRDLSTLTATLEEMHLLGFGDETCGLSVVVGDRLLSELLCAKHDSVSVMRMSTQASDLSLVEDYMLTCGQLAFTGGEVFAAIEKRQELVGALFQENPTSYRDVLGIITQKALLSNLMISRDMEGLTEAMETVKHSQDESKLSLPECLAARKLLAEYAIATTSLDAAIETGSLHELEDALALCAYNNFYSDMVVEGIDLMLEISQDPFKNLLSPILTGLRTGDKDAVAQGLYAASRAGWRIPALASYVAPKILTMREKLLQEENVKNRLIKTALAVKNGLTTQPGEMIQVMRRATAMGLQADTTLKNYIQLIEKQMRKMSHVLKMDEAVQHMIDTKDMPSLMCLLAGRGSGKLIVSAPSLEIMQEWQLRIRDVCDGIFHVAGRRLDPASAEADEYNGITMNGTLEKAARTESGALKNWRHRYFILQGKWLSYHTSQGSEKKGTFFVRGGAVRALKPEESGGRLNSLEILEGRDVTLIDPDLIEEAKKVVCQAKKHEIEESVLLGIEKQSQAMIARGLKDAEEVGLTLDEDIFRDAKQCMQQLHLLQLKRDLQQAADTVPRTLLDDLIKSAYAANMDPNNSLFGIVLKLATKTEIEQAIVRVRGALRHGRDGDFQRAFMQVCKFDYKRFTMRDNNMLSAVILQHAGVSVLRSFWDGDSMFNKSKQLKHALTCCQHLYVETEPMQLSRLLIASASLQSSSTVITQGGFDRSGSCGAYLNELKYNPALSTHYALDKYDHLRAKSSRKSKGIFALFPSKKKMSKRKAGDAVVSELLSYNPDKMSKSLLKLESAEVSASLELFEGLKVVMGDKDLSSIWFGKMRYPVFKTKRPDVAWLVSDIVDYAISKVNLRDEIYLHLCKQLTCNPRVISRLRGWLIFSVYLHAFPPSSSLLLYLRNFVIFAAAAETMASSKTADHAEQSSGTETDVVALIVRLASYCTKLLSGVEGVYYSCTASATPLDAKTAAALALVSNSTNTLNNVQLPTLAIPRDLAAMILGRKQLTLDIILMTGSVHRFEFKYGDCDTPSSLLPLLYSRLMGGASVLKAVVDANGLRERGKGVNTWTDWLIKQFRGFNFYELDSDIEVVSDDVLHGLQRMPIQPNDSKVLEWQHDLLWSLLTSCLDSASATRSDGTPSPPQHKTLVLRKRLSSRSELFANQFEMFNDQVADKDIIGCQSLWTTWLQAAGPVPADAMRIDLLFAEETRYVNSRLYPCTNEALAYLVGLQLALNWEEEDACSWGDGHHKVFADVDLSIRPCHKYLPNCLYYRKVAAGDDGEAASRGGGGGGGGGAAFALHGRSSDKAKQGAQDEEAERLGGFFRRGMVGGSDVHRVGAVVNRQTMRLQEQDRDESKADNASEGSESEESDYERFDLMYQSGNYSDEDERHSDYNYSVNSDEQSSVFTMTREINNKPKNLITSFSELTPLEISEIKSKLAFLGHEPTDQLVAAVVHWIIKFHIIAVENEIETNHPKYRYYLKRAYVQYVMAMPLFGHHLQEAQLHCDGQTDCSVVVAISVHSLSLLHADTWELMFVTDLWDIESIFLDEPDGQVTPSLKLVVNSMSLQLISCTARDQHHQLLACTKEALGCGCFPHGCEGGNDVVDVGEAIVPQYSAKEALKRFLRDFSLLPTPPPVSPLIRSVKYFESPRSRRQLLAEERADEEQRELEQARFAADAHMEKLQMEMEKGRSAVSKFNDDNDGSDGSDDGHKRSKSPVAAKKVTRRNRSVIGRASMVNSGQLLQSRISAGVCGVAAPRSMGREAGVIHVLPQPSRQAGLIRLDMLERKRGLQRPVRPRAADRLAQHPCHLKAATVTWTRSIVSSATHKKHLLGQASTNIAAAASAGQTPAIYVNVDHAWGPALYQFHSRSEAQLDKQVAGQRLIACGSGRGGIAHDVVEGGGVFKSRNLEYVALQQSRWGNNKSNK